MERHEPTQFEVTTNDFEGRCLDCGYQLRGLTVYRCPECGRAFDPHDAGTFRRVGSPKPARWTVVIVTCLFIGGPCVLVVMPDLLNSSDVKIGVPNAALAGGWALALAVDLYRSHVGHYPRTLADLVNRPSDPGEAAGWSGPYLNDPTPPMDSWGHPFQYRVPGTHNQQSYDLWSVGPDGQNGTEDDVGNW